MTGVIALIAVGVAVLTSYLTTKIITIHYFKVIDGYVKGLFEDTKKALSNQKNRKSEARAKSSANMFTLYADSEPYLQELRISLTPHDWYEFQKQPFYQELTKYLDNLQTQKSIDILVEKQD